MKKISDETKFANMEIYENFYKCLKVIDAKPTIGSFELDSIHLDTLIQRLEKYLELKQPGEDPLPTAYHQLDWLTVRSQIRFTRFLIEQTDKQNCFLGRGPLQALLRDLNQIKLLRG